MYRNAEIRRVFEVLRSRHSYEFAVGHIPYLIQPDNNKGCDYLSLWQTGSRQLCLGSALYEILDGLEAETVADLLSQPLFHGESYLSLWEKGLIQPLEE